MTRTNAPKMKVRNLVAMRFEPLDSLTKNVYISPKWTKERLEMVAEARRVIGYGGAFPPYEGLRKKLAAAKSFEEAFGLRPVGLRKSPAAFLPLDACWWRGKQDALPALVEGEQGTVY